MNNTFNENFHRRKNSLNIWVVMELIKTMILISLIEEIPTAQARLEKDDLHVFREMSREQNPTRNIKANTFGGIDLYQPYYICGNDDSSDALLMHEWHYSCKQSCSDTNERHKVNITRMKWDFIGEDVHVYKVRTTVVCYTSHVNVWGSCSHARTSTPENTNQADLDELKKTYFGKDRAAQLGMQNIINSGRAECSYFSDNTKCNRDYVVHHLIGKISKKSESDNAVMNIYTDGIRVDPHLGSVHLNAISYMWDVNSIRHPDECGWKEVKDTTCTMVETSDTLKCDDIGYSYNIHDTYHKPTCNGEIYDIDGPSPFKFLTKEMIANRSRVVKDALAGKSDPDISFITGINYAFSELETTYCSSTCDLFSKVNPSSSDHVLDTPIGTWRVQSYPNGHPKMLPCMPTSNWTIKSPFTMCTSPNTILVVDRDTKHVNMWDARKDYIILDQLCGGTQDQTGKPHMMLREKIRRGEEFEISFWNGDAIVVAPPYTTPQWRKSKHTVKSNPSWFTKVKLDKDMIHSKEDISGLLTQYVSNVSHSLINETSSGRTVYRFLADEVLEGVETVGSTILGGITGFFGSITKIITLLMIVIIVLLSAKSAILIRRAFRKKKQKKRESTVSFVDRNYGSNKAKVTWEDQMNEELVTGTSYDRAPPPYELTKKTRSSRRAELATLLNN